MLPFFIYSLCAHTNSFTPSCFLLIEAQLILLIFYSFNTHIGFIFYEIAKCAIELMGTTYFLGLLLLLSEYFIHI